MAWNAYSCTNEHSGPHFWEDQFGEGLIFQWSLEMIGGNSNITRLGS